MLKRRKMKAGLAAVLLAALLASGCGSGEAPEDNMEKTEQVSETLQEQEAGDKEEASETGDETDAEKVEGEGNAAEEDFEEALLKLEEEEKALVPVELSMEDNYRTYYEVFVYSFFDGNGDGIGDLKGLTDQLDYINDGDPATTEDLGCTGIWLMPIMPSPSYHKYDVTDYYEIDPEYGTMEDFDAFMEECNKRGIKVILDLVLNHSSSEHPWFQEACKYLVELGDGSPSIEECPYVDYYHFAKEAQTGYSQVPGSDVWYYEAQFYEGMPDLNLYNEELREEIGKIVDFWFAKGVGGFRLDAAKEYETGVDSANIEILTWFTQLVKEKKKDAYLVAEVWMDIATYSQYYDSGIDSVFNFAFADAEGLIANVVKGSSPASSYGKSLENIQGMFREHNPAYIDAPFYTNHDLARSAGYYSGETAQSQTKIAGAMNLLMSGNAFVYYGEELGMKGSGKDENKRAPMYFFDDKNAPGMCKGPGDMDSVKMKYGSLEEQRQDPYSVYHYYKKAIRLRNAFTEIRKGKVTDLPELASDTVSAFSKNWNGETVYIFCNTSPNPRNLYIAEIASKVDGIAGALYVDEKEGSLEGNVLSVPGYGVMVLK